MDDAGLFNEVQSRLKKRNGRWFSTLGILWRITLPLSLSGIIATGIFTFIFIWNEFLFGLVLTHTNARTLPVALTVISVPNQVFG
jgi:ABC-type glycerol-3-phosphate transport system permease component